MADTKSDVGKRLHWAARICLVASAVGVLISSCYFYHPSSYPFSGLSLQIGQTLAYGGFKLFQFFGPPFILIPPLLYYALYGIFILGGILHLITAWGQRRTASSMPPSQ